VSATTRSALAPRCTTIAFYCGDSVEPWGPDSLRRGIGGSEEALIHITRHLHALGWRVDVYANPPRDERGCRDGVHWHHHESFPRDRPGAIFVAWRDAAFAAHGRGWRQVHHWVHNRQDWPYPADIADAVDRILVVSRHHATDEGFEDVDPRKIHCTMNGLDDAYLVPAGRNEPRRAIYASCPARGLITLLEMWPAILREVPDAWLDVYNGFTAIYEDMARELPGLLYIKQRCLELLDQPRVRFHGMVGQHELSEAFARAGVWLYPTQTRETSCITAMKALAMGALPVTSGYAVLGETLGGHDLGPVHESRPITASRFRIWQYRRRVVWAMRHGAGEKLHARRLAGAEWARRTYSWRRIARDWCRLFEQVDVEKHGRTRSA